MGDARADGGDELSQAMGKAVDTLGGLDAFAGTSDWYHDLTNIGCQYSSHEFNSASVFNLTDIAHFTSQLLCSQCHGPIENCSGCYMSQFD
jgi:hypothetical protein